MGEIYQTDLEIELIKALQEKGIDFVELSREQLKRFAESDYEKYPEFDPELVFGEHFWGDNVQEKIYKLLIAGFELRKLPIQSSKLSIGSRLLGHVFGGKETIGTYKQIVVPINDFSIDYKLEIDPINDLDLAFKKGFKLETLDVLKMIEEKPLTILGLIRGRCFQERYNLTLLDKIEEYVDYKFFDDFIPYVRKHRPEDHKFIPKEFVKSLMNLVLS